VLAVVGSGGKALWYLTRGTGLVALVLLTMSVVLGIVTTVRWQSPRWPRFITAALHRNVSLLVMVLLAIHIVTAVADSYAPIRWLDVVLPYGSTYRPLWLGLGALSFDLILALNISSLLRQRIGYPAWRVIHWSAYACWPVALLHGLGTGSDTRLGWVALVNVGCLAAVVAALWWRLAVGWPAQRQRRTLAAVASVAVPLAIVGWMVAEPMRAGWARRAGTPSALLGLARPAVAIQATKAAPGSTRPPPSAGAAPFGAPFTANLQGTLQQTQPDGQGQATATIDGRLSNGVNGVLHIVLQGSALENGGIEMSQSSATAGPSAEPSLYQGRVVSLQGASIVVALRRSDGTPLQLSIQLQIDATGSGVTGTVQASA
jgi:sulfoxide reductase heme-binding subunit YedZ